MGDQHSLGLWREEGKESEVEDGAEGRRGGRRGGEGRRLMNRTTVTDEEKMKDTPTRDPPLKRWVCLLCGICVCGKGGGGGGGRGQIGRKAAAAAACGG